MKLTERELRIVTLTRALVNAKVNALPQGMMNIGYLWGNITIRRAQKNGKLRTFDVKTCFGSFSPFCWGDAMKAAGTVADVHPTHVNMD